MSPSTIRKRGVKLAVLFARQHGLCHWCGDEMVLGAEFEGLNYRATRDHCEPIEALGRYADSPTNLVAACNWCNQHKGNASLADWLASLPHRLKCRNADRQRRAQHRTWSREGLRCLTADTLPRQTVAGSTQAPHSAARQ